MVFFELYYTGDTSRPNNKKVIASQEDLQGGDSINSTNVLRLTEDDFHTGGMQWVLRESTLGILTAGLGRQGIQDAGRASGPIAG